LLKLVVARERVAEPPSGPARRLPKGVGVSTTGVHSHPWRELWTLSTPTHIFGQIA